MTPEQEREFLKNKMCELAKQGCDRTLVREKATLALWLEREVQELREVLGSTWTP